MADNEPEMQLETGNGGTGGNRPTRIGSGNLHPSDSVICCSCKLHVSSYLPVLPHMAAYVCSDCIRKKKQRAIPVSDISNKSLAPWTEDEVASINEYQRSNKFLPFVCSERHNLTAKSDGFSCPICPQFFLNWTYPWVLNSFWKQL